MSENTASQSKKSFPVWLTLALVCIIVAGVLGLTNNITEGPIAESAAAKVLASMQEAFPAADEFIPLEIAEGSSVQECNEAYENGELIGYITTLTVTGCKGPIEIQAGYDLEGKITAFTCGGSNFQETAGLGSKVKDAAFREQFYGKATPLAYGSDGLDSITGATISSGAVLSGLNTAGYYVADLINPPAESNAPEDLVFGGVLPGAETKEQVDPAPEGADELYTSNAGAVVYVTGQGRNGTVQVQVGVANSGQVAGVYIPHEMHSETQGLGDAIENAYFTNRFLGLDSSNLDGVDTISGATISSTCVKDCVKKAVEIAQPYLDESAAFDISEWFSGAVAEEPVDEAAAAAEEAAEAAKAALETYTPYDGRLAEFVNAAYTDGDRVVSDISVPGLFGDINLIAGVDADGNIDAMTTLSHSESALGAPQLTPDALSKLFGTNTPDAVDVVSGASTTSGALQKAVIAACSQYDIVTGKAPAEEPAPVEEEPAPSAEAAPAAAGAELAEFVNSFSVEGDRVVSDISVPGLFGNINLIVGVGPDGNIDEMTTVSHSESELGAPQLTDEALAKLIGTNSPDAVDVVSGASTTSGALQKAVTAACEQFALAAAAAPAEEPAPVEEEPAPAEEAAPAAAGAELAEFVNSFSVEDGHVVSDVSVPGLFGDINLIICVGPDGMIDEITTVSHSESALGAPQLTDEALAKLIGTNSPDAVDVVSGASTTSGALQKAVTAACEQFALAAAAPAEEEPVPAEEATPAAEVELAEFVNSFSIDGDRVVSDISVPGLFGDINLIVGVGPDGNIDEMTTVSHSESALGAPQLTDEALAKLIGTNSPDAVDVVSGASTTSGALQKAVTAACEQFALAAAAPAEEEAAEIEIELAEFVNSFSVEDGHVVSDISVPGLFGDINLIICVDPDGNIDEITTVSHSESALGAPQLTDEALAKLIGTNSPDAVDVVSGASTTSGALQKAVVAACEQFANVKAAEGGSDAAAVEYELAEFVNSVSVEDGHVVSDVSVPGLFGDINLIICVGPDGMIDEITTVSHSESALGAPQLTDEALAKLIGTNSPDAVDVVSGASTTSGALQKAVTAACAQYDIVKAA